MQLEETNVAKQRLEEHVPAASDTQATTEELVDAVFSVRSVRRMHFKLDSEDNIYMTSGT